METRRENHDRMAREAEMNRPKTREIRKISAGELDATMKEDGKQEKGSRARAPTTGNDMLENLEKMKAWLRST